MLRLTSETHRKGPAVPECSRFLLGLALVLTIISDGVMNNEFTALSTMITANSNPSALQQLATFAAMEDVAEEEHLDWGSTGRLVQKQTRSMAKPRNASPPDPTSLGSLSSHTHSRTDSETTLSDGLSKSFTDMSTNVAVGTSSAASSSCSRRRPHRRHHRRSGAVSDVSSSDDTTAALSASRPVHSYQMWTQFHVMEMAYSTGSNNFVHITERFVEYQQMFPIIYRCDLSKVECPYEPELLAFPTVGLASSSRWACQNCGKKHNVVRENCVRCRSPGKYTKLFIGQAVKEVGCTGSLVRFLYATHPDIVIHRADCHHSDADASQRGKGCASIYVGREDAALLQQKLHHNAFFDVDSVTKELVVYYVYTEQQQWLHSYAEHRNSLPAKRPLFLPVSPLVVEGSSSSSAPERRFVGHGQRCRHDRGHDSMTLFSAQKVH
ncbi:hypothetical protein, conserved [Leishmania tarentolae]|uniref:Uncharacterized protein n=1 Tax=Leishmania tarentolae TaxID=5689 RepID=A0A640KAV9_LEITA|nr:hypothetical protein, conserved [Leishmania tarentolae]